MSRSAAISFDWADGEHTFRLKLGQLRELQEKCDAGPAFIYNRLVNHTWRIDEVRETIRLGLIGGGMKPIDALKLVQRYVDERPLYESVLPAQLILGATLSGVPDEYPGKSAAAEADDKLASFPTESSPSPPSTEQVQ